MSSRNDFLRYLIVASTTCSLIIGGTWLYTQQFPLFFEESGYTVWRAKFDAISNCSTGNDVILGDSQAQAAFIPSAYSDSSYNLALGGSTSLEAYLVLKKLAHCLRPGQHIMLSLSPPGITKLSVWLWENGARYGFINFSDLQELASGFQASNDDSFSQFRTRVGSGLLRDVLYGIQFPSLYFDNLVKARIALRRSVNQELLSHAKAQKGFLPFRYQGGVAELKLNDQPQRFHVLAGEDFFLRKMLKIAIDKDVKIDFISMPLPESYHSLFTKNFQSEFSNYLADVSTSSKGSFRVIGRVFRFYPDQLFSDSSHLGEQGAYQFTKWLAQCRINNHCIE